MPAVQLKQGLSITVSIIEQQKTGVVMISSRAITRSGRTATVQVVKDDGTTETRTVTTGITNGTYTEIVSGLAEGEKVVLTSTTSSSSSNSSTNRQDGGVMIPGLGGLR